MTLPKYVFEAEYDLLDDDASLSRVRRVTGHIEGPTLSFVTNELSRQLQEHPYANVNALHVGRMTGTQWLERMQEQLAQGYPLDQFQRREGRLQELCAREWTAE
jgi:hypothetical protein